jgi:hypothetical protein
MAKWDILIYGMKEIRKIKKFFKDTKIKVAFETKNTIQNILIPVHN